MHGTHGLAFKTVCVLRALSVFIEFEVPRLERFVRVKRGGPIEAVSACVPEFGAFAEASSGQEEAVAVNSGAEAAVHAVNRRPFHGGIVEEFLPLFLGGDACTVAQPDGRDIVAWSQGGQVVGEAVETILRFVAVLGQFVPGIAISIGAPFVHVLRPDLPPGIVVAIFHWGAGAHVA